MSAIGKKVIYNGDMHDIEPRFYPPKGTVGRVVEENNYSYQVQWPKGTTSDNDCWWARKMNCAIIEEENEMDTERYCADCGEKIAEGDEFYETADGRIICESCYEDSYFTCEDCGDIYPMDDAVSVNNGEMYVCQDCADVTGNYYRCVSCDEYFTPRYRSRYELANGDCVCNRCADGNIAACYDCDEYFWIEDMEEDEDGWGDTIYFCPSCVRGRKKKIHDYSYKPAPKFKVHNHDEFWTDDSIKELLFGVELEIDKGKDPEKVAEEITEAHDDIYCKHDGSLDYGVEIVSHPCTLEYHLKDLGWDDICDIALNNNFKSHEARTCGLHVHVGRRQLGETISKRNDNVAKIIILVDRHWDNIVRFTRRTEEQLSHWASRPEIMDRIIGFSDGYIGPKVTDMIGGRGRYQAVNTQNRNTIEFRIYNGTLKVSTLYATLQFTSNICKYAMTHSFDDCFASQWKDVAEHETYPELAEYLVSRNLDDVPYLEPTARNTVAVSEDGKIKVGSRVRIVNNDGAGVFDLIHHIGERATVIADGTSGYDFGIEFDNPSRDFHNLLGMARLDRGYWVHAGNIELVENEGGAEVCA